jgi:hypothetical protein
VTQQRLQKKIDDLNQDLKQNASHERRACMLGRVPGHRRITRSLTLG